MKPFNLSGEIAVAGKNLSVKDTVVGALHAVHADEANSGLGDKLFRHDLIRKITEAKELAAVDLTLAEALTVIERVHKQYSNAPIVGHFYDMLHNALEPDPVQSSSG